jgi:hypothetical protein
METPGEVVGYEESRALMPCVDGFYAHHFFITGISGRLLLAREVRYTPSLQYKQCVNF